MKDTTFYKKRTINCGGKLLDLSTPKVMGIVNVTPDSFYDGGKNDTEKNVLQLCEKHLTEGATILDIGGQSTRPGAVQIPIEEEINRISPAIYSIHKHFPEAILSIDSYRSAVVKEAISNGAHIINDISSGSLDENMLKTIVELNVPYIASHIQGNPENMQNSPQYNDVTIEVGKSFAELKNKLYQQGVKDIIFDPGYGFGKTVDQNFELLKNLNHFSFLDTPILVGVSRKSMIWLTLKNTPEEALNGTTALNSIALLKGANILRVHDVKEAVECVQLIEQIR